MRPLLFSLSLAFLTGGTAVAATDLAGRWDFAAGDPAAAVAPPVGYKDTILLPGTTDLGRKGVHVIASAPYHYYLTREWDVTGPAYYSRTVVVPAADAGKEHELFLERVMWTSRVWVDGAETSPAEDSLSTPHIHRLGRLAAGTHRITVMVDNRMAHPIGDKGHGYGPQTQSLWNGVVGRIELRALPEHRITRVRVFPHDDGTADVEADGVFDQGMTLAASVEGEAATPALAAPATGSRTVLKGRLVAAPVLWSEFSPKTYRLRVELRDASGKTEDTRTADFGFREIRRDGNRLLENGREIFLRGNLECAVFPKLGHPPADVESWRKIWRVYREHDLNHARFHSWTPPEAAFTAADEAGIRLQVETPIWIDGWMTHPNSRPEMDTPGYPKGLGRGDRTIDTFAQAELRRILDTYGNHPSFEFLALGNELGPSDFDVTGKWIRDAKAYDPRRLYAASTARVITPYCDFSATHNIPGIGWCRQHVEFGTDWDYAKLYTKAPVPIIAHEVGQWPVYPDWSELKKYDGPLKPYRLEEMEADAALKGMASRSPEYRAASGASNRILYRYEIESFLRTRGCRGFQLLGMQDFTGQGEALVGWLDPFYETKGTTDPALFRHYCAPVTPLLRLPGFVFKNTDRPAIRAVLAQYGPETLKGATAAWTLRDDAGATLDAGTFAAADFPAGDVADIGGFTPDFSKVEKASHLRLELAVAGKTNGYDLWVYPETSDAVPEGVTVATMWEDARRALDAGGAVVLDAHLLGGAKASKLANWFPLYWSVPFFPGQRIETIGTIVHRDHPAFAGFPTSGFTDWNWFRICPGAHGFDVTDITTPDFRGIAEPVSDFHLNRRLASIFEARVGRGRLLVSGYDISQAACKKYPETAALRRSLLDYAASTAFKPVATFAPAVLEKLFDNPELALPPVPPEYAKADLYVKAAARYAGFDRAEPYARGFDGVLRRAEGVDYTVKADGVWRDAHGAAWFGRKIVVEIKPRPGVAGTFRVRFEDWNDNGRTGTVTFEGKTEKLGDHRKGEWVEFHAIREDSNDGKFVLEADCATGPNLMITDIVFVPEE